MSSTIIQDKDSLKITVENDLYKSTIETTQDRITCKVEEKIHTEMN
ncbi:hypothetical protein [Bacillus sp. Marseille-P3800]|nr:hypothetical protein [Bacillus sp. Marseille-P3800]